VISTEEIQRVVPIPARPVIPDYVMPGTPVPATRPSPAGKTNRGALASFICALAGIPLFGLITGAFAVIIGALSLGTIEHKHQKGRGYAIAGICIGIVDFVGWMVFVFMYATHHPIPGFVHSDRMPHIADFAALPKPLRQAMLANVLIVQHSLTGEALGSGVILGIEGGQAEILTCRHVVDPNFNPDATTSSGDSPSLKPIDVTMVGQPVTSGNVIWVAPAGVDLALVQVPCKSADIVAAPWRSTDYRGNIGDQCFAIGNPNAWGWTHSPGAISQFRPLHTPDKELSVIQTTAPINPGNSGGGLYDRDGTLIGINTWIDGNPGAQGLGFAISFDSFLAVVPKNLLPSSVKLSTEPSQP
jgi:hypothetical protein